MEKYGIGTDGTIPTYVKKIEEKNFVEPVILNGVRRLKPTALGETIAEIYLEVDDVMIKPNVRSFIEQCCNKIINYDMEPEVVKEKVISVFREKLDKSYLIFKIVILFSKTN